jgi:hypothetical protein
LPIPGSGYWPEDLDAGLFELRQMATVQAAVEARTSWTQRILGAIDGLLAVWAFGVVLVGWPRRQVPGTGGEMAGWYARLARWGARLGRPLRPADTPREYASGIVHTAQTLAHRAWLGPGRATTAAATVQADAPRLAQAFEAALYSPYGDGTFVSAGASAGPRGTSRHTWSDLWAALRRLWLARWRI